MTFARRLAHVQKSGNLTVADLARWFGRSYQTVRYWANGTSQPGGAPMDREHAEELLRLLEGMVKKKQRFPVPRLSPAKRIEYIQDIRVRLLG